MYHDITSMKSSHFDSVRTICCDVWMPFVSSTYIGLAFTFVTFVIFMLIRLNPDTLCTIPDGRVPSSQAPSFHRESRSTRGDGNFGNLHDFYIFFSTGTCSGQTPCGRARKRGSENLLFHTFSFLETLTSNYFPGVFSFLHCNSCQCSRDFCSSLEASCISKKSTFHVLPTMQATEVASLQLSLAHAADEDCCAAPVSKIHISAVSRFEMFHKKL